MNLLPDQFLASLCEQMRQQANSSIWDGRSFSPYFWACRHQIIVQGISLIFTRDEGHHSSGWFKNPDFERCYHLSLSFRDGFQRNVAGQIAKALFGENHLRLRIEPPYSKEGKQSEVYHYRLFCDATWQPIHPKGEVYSTENTPLDWKSFSEIHDESSLVIRPL